MSNQLFYIYFIKMNQNSNFLIVFYFLMTYNLRALNYDLTQNNDRFRNAVSILSINSNSCHSIAKFFN